MHPLTHSLCKDVLVLDIAGAEKLPEMYSCSEKKVKAIFKLSLGWEEIVE